MVEGLGGELVGVGGAARPRGLRCELEFGALELACRAGDRSHGDGDGCGHTTCGCSHTMCGCSRAAGGDPVDHGQVVVFHGRCVEFELLLLRRLKPAPPNPPWTFEGGSGGGFGHTSTRSSRESGLVFTLSQGGCGFQVQGGGHAKSGVKEADGLMQPFMVIESVRFVLP